MPKAKELRPFVERLITIAKRGVAAGDGAAVSDEAELRLRAKTAAHSRLACVTASKRHQQDSNTKGARGRPFSIRRTFPVG